MSFILASPAFLNLKLKISRVQIMPTQLATSLPSSQVCPVQKFCPLHPAAAPKQTDLHWEPTVSQALCLILENFDKNVYSPNEEDT